MEKVPDKTFTIPPDELQITEHSLGDGVLSCVYHGLWKGAPVAVKQIHERVLHQSSQLSRRDLDEALRAAHREMRIMANLRHPNIVTLYGIHSVGTSHVAIVMELMHTSLRRRSRAEPYLSVATITRILRDMASALTYLHSRGVFHRDVSPNNTLLDANDSIAKLSDFAGSKVWEDTAEFGEHSSKSGYVGTLPYLPYEAVDGDPFTGRVTYTPKVDVYGVAAVGLDTIFRQTPGKTARAKPVFLRRLCDEPGCNILYPILTICLSEDPDQRPTSNELQEQLDDLLKTIRKHPAEEKQRSLEDTLRGREEAVRGREESEQRLQLVRRELEESRRREEVAGQRLQQLSDQVQVVTTERNALQGEIQQLRQRLEQTNADDAIARAQSALKRMSTRDPALGLSDRDRAAVYQLQAQEARLELLECHVLFSCKLVDFQINRMIAHGTEGAVFLATCQQFRHPDRSKAYALKAMFNIFQLSTLTQVREQYHQEYEVLVTLPPHRNIVRLHAFFYDRLGDSLPEMTQFDALRDVARSMSLILVMEYYPRTLAQACRQLRESGQFTLEILLDWATQIAEAAQFLAQNNFVHRDMKLDNILLSQDGVVKVCDFGFALHCQTSNLRAQYHPGMAVGGNPAHLAPEILTAQRRLARQRGGMIDYSKQPVWDLAVLIFEMATGTTPFAASGLDQQGYRTADLPALTLPRVQHAPRQPSSQTKLAIQTLVKNMLSFEPANRPTLSQVTTTLSGFARQFPIN